MRELALLAASVACTLALGVALVRWLAPGLLGLPVDLQIVQVSDEVTPFYETVFAETGDPRELIRDPHTVVRGQPLAPDIGVRGPHDVLGFRNRSVPNRADVVTIGDSQTYGSSVRLEATWPQRIARRLRDTDVKVYNMSMGGWGAVQYLDMFGKSGVFEPRVAVVAFYSGNDAHESFRAAYAIDAWASLRPDPSLDLSDLPRDEPGETREWAVPIGGVPMIFTPAMRLRSNDDQPAVRGGWQIMAESGRRIARRARKRGVTPVFTILPTKELVYALVVRGAVADVDPSYAALVRAEAKNVAELAATLRSLEGARYVDVLVPLQDAALRGEPLYDVTRNGHPQEAGHAVIARALAGPIAEALAR